MVDPSYTYSAPNKQRTTYTSASNLGVSCCWRLQHSCTAVVVQFPARALMRVHFLPQCARSECPTLHFSRFRGNQIYKILDRHLRGETRLNSKKVLFGCFPTYCSRLPPLSDTPCFFTQVPLCPWSVFGRAGDTNPPQGGGVGVYFKNMCFRTRPGSICSGPCPC